MKSEPRPTEEDTNFQLTSTGWKVELEENYLDCEIKAETLLSDRRDVKRNSMPTVLQPESSMSLKHTKAAVKARASRLIKSSFDRKDSKLVQSLVQANTSQTRMSAIAQSNSNASRRNEPLDTQSRRDPPNSAVKPKPNKARQSPTSRLIRFKNAKTKSR